MKNNNDWREKATFETLLANFIDFVGKEAKRNDLEKQGVNIRDGGRAINCNIFLKQLLTHVFSQKQEEIIGEMEELKRIADTIIGGTLDERKSYDKALSNAQEIIRNKLK